MADLDDFFAKKDKKKSKPKSKFVTPEELVKNLEETKKEVAAAAKAKKPDAVISSANVAATIGGVATVTDSSDGENNTTAAAKVVEQPVEEEWKDFEQEQRKDYSGLKIAQLTINEGSNQRQQTQTEVDEEDVDSEGNSNTDYTSKRVGYGPWKKLIPAEEVTQIPVEIEKPSKVYISPALRQSQLGAGTGLRPTRNRAAPDITNAEFFPTLNAARPEEQRKKKNEPAFEEVRHGGRVQRVQDQTAAAPTAATNRFQSLDDEDDS